MEYFYILINLLLHKTICKVVKIKIENEHNRKSNIGRIKYLTKKKKKIVFVWIGPIGLLHKPLYLNCPISLLESACHHSPKAKDSFP